MKSIAPALTIFALSMLALPAQAQPTEDAAPTCHSYSHWVGRSQVNIVDFRGKDPSSPFRFRLKAHSYDSVPSDGYFGPITRGELTFSYPRQANPEVPYVKGAPYPAPYTQGPAFGEKVSYQAREIACNVFEVHWKETLKGDTVTHVQDYNRQQVCTNITNINRQPIPAGFDPFDLRHQFSNRTLFPEGSPLEQPGFGWFNLCGTMSQSLESDRVWEDQLGFLVYNAP